MVDFAPPQQWCFIQVTPIAVITDVPVLCQVKLHATSVYERRGHVSKHSRSQWFQARPQQHYSLHSLARTFFSESLFLVFSTKLLRFFRKLPLLCPCKHAVPKRVLSMQVDTSVGIIIENSLPMGRRLDSDYGKAEKRKRRVL